MEHQDCTLFYLFIKNKKNAENKMKKNLIWGFFVFLKQCRCGRFLFEQVFCFHTCVSETLITWVHCVLRKNIFILKSYFCLYENSKTDAQLYFSLSVSPLKWLDDLIIDHLLASAGSHSHFIWENYLLKSPKCYHEAHGNQLHQVRNLNNTI